jgi:hypothetical protein
MSVHVLMFHPAAIMSRRSCLLANVDTMVAQLIEIIGFIEVENRVDEFVESAITSSHIRGKQQTAHLMATSCNVVENKTLFPINTATVTCKRNSELSPQSKQE